MAAHTAQEITYQQSLDCPHEMAPGVAEFSKDSPAPVTLDKDGQYPVPTPGVTVDREYGATA